MTSALPGINRDPTVYPLYEAAVYLSVGREERTTPTSLSLSVSGRAVGLDWSPPGRPSGIMLGYEILRWTLRSCAVGEKSAGVGEEKLRCSYVQCPAGHGVCGTSCFHPDAQVTCVFGRLPPFSSFIVSLNHNLRLFIETFAAQQQQQHCVK